MKKLSTVLFTIAVLFACALPARAATRHMEYETFSIDVPDSWNAEKEERSDGEYVAFGTRDETAMCGVLVMPSSGLSSKEFAERVRESTDGSKLADNGDGLYRFTSEAGGVETRNLLGVLNQSAIVITVAGDDPDLLSVTASIRFKLEFRPYVKRLF
jgi:hypothetical protein